MLACVRRRGPDFVLYHGVLGGPDVAARLGGEVHHGWLRLCYAIHGIAVSVLLHLCTHGNPPNSLAYRSRVFFWFSVFFSILALLRSPPVSVSLLSSFNSLLRDHCHMRSYCRNLVVWGVGLSGGRGNSFLGTHSCSYCPTSPHCSYCTKIFLNRVQTLFFFTRPLLPL